jgi:hypothetical protein
MSFKDLKKNRNDSYAKIVEDVEKQEKSTAFEADPDDWYPGVDKSGNGLSIIRFLPGIEGEDMDFVKVISHEFQDPNTQKWYIENSKRSLDKKAADPVAEMNNRLWKAGGEKSPERAQASLQKQKTRYRALVYILADSANPENNGTIKRFKFGQTIFDFIKNALTPQLIENVPADQQTKGFNPFDLYDGANFRISIFTEKKGESNYRNYSRSTWAAIAPLVGTVEKPDEKKMEAIYNGYQTEPERWSLKKFVAEDQFKSYDELLTKLNDTLGYDSKTGNLISSKKEVAKETPKQAVKETVAPVEKAAEAKEASSTPADSENDDYFQNLINDE